MTSLTHCRLMEALHYDPETGIFTSRIATGYRGCHPAGRLCGCLDRTTGYVRIGLDGEQHWAHRLAWFYVHGAWPPADIDHRDRNRANNALRNLRSATRSQNLHNQVAPAPNSRSGVRGVSWDAARQKWKVGISIDGHTRHLGRFDTQDAAAQAYAAAKLVQLEYPAP